MKKKNITCMIIFLVGILFGVFGKFGYDTIRPSQMPVKKDYVSLGNIVDTTVFYKHIDKKYASLDVNTSYNNSDGLVPNAKTAAIIAIAILNGIYGEQTINKEKPFNVKLYNNKVWCVSGVLPNGYHGGVAVISIRKSNGEVLNYFHSK